MSLWRHITRGVRGLTNRSAADQDIADEVRHYLDEAAAVLRAGGLSADEARRAARLELGTATLIGEQVRAYGWENTIGTLIDDVRYGIRRLRADASFTVGACVILALGIGASTAVFSAVNPILFEPLPYPRADRVVMIWDRGTDGSRMDVTFGTYRELIDRSHSFDALAVVKPWQPTGTGAGEPERFDGQRVSAAYFQVLGVRPALGRDFAMFDDRPGAPNVAILSDGLWRRRFGADGTVVGRSIALDDSSYTVVGVMPAGFENVLAPSAEIWSPLEYDAALPPDGREWGHHLRMVGRLRHSIGTDAAMRELDAIARGPVGEFRRVPWASLQHGFIVSSLQDDVTRGVRPALLAVAGAVSLVLAIACVNVMNLLLARGAQRRGELAVRVALGAGRSRLVRQLVTESLLLATVGGGLGILVAELGIRALVALGPAGLPRVNAIRLDVAVFGFALGVTALVGVIVGLIPALHGSRTDLHTNLQQRSHRMAGGHGFTRSALVVAEIALALVLLVGAGLLLRSVQHLFAVACGFDPSHVLTMQVQTSGHRLDDAAATHRFFAQAVDAVRRVPGVTAAAFTSQLPLSGDFDRYGVQFESSSHDSREDRSTFRYAVTPGYFEAMAIPLRSGRLLDARDRAGAPVAVMINESFAKRTFPAGDAIGQRLHIGRTDLPWYTIVGIVGDVKQASLAASDGDAVYITTTQWYSADRVLSLVVRAQGDAAAIASGIRQAIWSVDKDQPIVRVATMDALVAASEAERRFALVLFEVFALAALALATTGIYGVLSGSVTERTREIGVRSALGASPADILTLVAGRGLALTSLGIAIGLVGAAVATRVLVTLLFGVSRLDAATYAGVIALLAGASAIACSVPAWRAARVDPSTALRE